MNVIMLSDARVEEFIALWEQAFGGRLSTADARTIAARLVSFYRLIMRPLPEAPLPPHQSEREPA